MIPGKDPTLTPNSYKMVCDALFGSEGGRLLLNHWEYMFVRQIDENYATLPDRALGIHLGKRSFVIDLMNVLDYGVEKEEDLTYEPGAEPEP